MMKFRVLALSSLAVALAAAAHAGVIDKAQRDGQAALTAQTWSAWGGELGVRWNRGLLSNIGVEVSLPQVPNPAAILFGEDQGRALVTTNDPEAVVALATEANIFAAPVGKTGGNAVSGPGFTAPLSDLRAAHEGFFPRLMGEVATLA